MKKSIKYIISSIICLVILAGIAFNPAMKAYAKSALNLVTTNSSKFLATTTTAYMTAGVGTTTLPLYTNGIDQVAFNVLYTASSTVNTNFLNWRYEYSWDGLVWFSEDIELTTSATTTTHVRDFAQHTWQFASSTAASSNTSLTASTDYKHFNLMNIASPFTRIVFYVPAGSGPAAIYVQAVTKENNTI